MYMVRPKTAPNIHEVAAAPAHITGLPSTVRGRKGSGTSLSHHTKARLSASEMPMRATMVDDVHGKRLPPDVSAISSMVAAATIRAAPIRSSWCGRSWRGSRFIAW